MQPDIDVSPPANIMPYRPGLTNLTFDSDPTLNTHQGPLNFSKNIVSLVQHGAYCALVVHIAP